MKKLALLVVVGFVTACASPTPYQAGSGDDPGYRDLKIQENRYRVAFKGNSVTPRETVEIYLLYRAAELTTALGMDYFIVQDQDTDKKTDYTVSPSGWSGGFGYGGRRRFAGIGYTTPVSESSQYEAITFITPRKGKMPEDNPAAYDAREVLKNLEPKIVRPNEK